MSRILTRRSVLTGIAATGTALILPGCERLGQSPRFQELVLESGNWLSYRIHRLIGGDALAREYSEAEMSPRFRTNGSDSIRSQAYADWEKNDFADWKLDIVGLIEKPQSFTLTELRNMPARTQITRHDCVEGWSAIGKWTGTPLSLILDAAQLKPEARYVVFNCADTIGLGSYYESIDLIDAYHPQTILAHGMNDEKLPIGHGAPIRLRVERQLGYKHAKFIKQIQLVASLEEIGTGKGGYWEDSNGYDWYAGI